MIVKSLEDSLVNEIDFTRERKEKIMAMRSMKKRQLYFFGHE